MVVVVGLLNLMLLLLVELVPRKNCHLLLEVIVQHLLHALFAGRLLLLYLLALVVVRLVLIVCLVTFYEIMFRPSLLNLMQWLYLLLPLSALLQLLYLVIVYLPLPRVVLPFVVVWKIIFIIYCISVCLDWCFCIHFVNCISMPVSMCFLFHHCLSHLSV